MMDLVSTTPDFISNLPNYVLENILMHLPLQDAVKTSVLSKKWRHNWKTLPLVFNNTFENHLKAQLLEKNGLLLTIYQVLLLHHGPVIKFTLSLLSLKSCPEIDHILNFLSRNGIQELTFVLRNGKPHKMPPCLFSCTSLRHLHLFYCIFKPPVPFNGLNRLISADFTHVYFDTGALQNLILKCPLLEQLILRYCQNVDHLEICAPNLKFLSIDPFCKSISFKDCPTLTSASIKDGDHKLKSTVKRENVIDMVEVFGCLPSIEYLYIGFRFLMILTTGNIPQRLPTSFNHLKTLVFAALCFEELAEVSCALCLIRSSPCLQRLMIMNACEHEHTTLDSDAKFWEVEKHSDILLHQLKEVQIMNAEGRRVETKFVKLILAKSPALKKFYINSSKNIDTNQEVRLLTEITRYRRASTVAEIIYSKP